MRTRARLATSALSLALLAGSAMAQPVLITTPTTVGPTDTTIGGVPLATADITVRGTTLTMNGRFTIGSLTIERSPGNVAGVLTHTANTSFDYSGGAGTDIVSGLDLTSIGPVLVEGASGPLVESRIDVVGRGFPGRQGPGTASYVGGGAGSGAGHGGAGSDGSNFLGGGCYGDPLAPSTFGSGGAGSCCSTPGAGGGRVRLVSGASIAINGRISADASPIGSGNNVGGGSGGSVFISAPDISGAGSVSANGSGGPDAAWGSGGGGRIAMAFSTSTLPIANITAFGGPAASPRLAGGAGTIVQLPAAQPASLIIDNNGQIGETTEFTGDLTLPGAIIRNGALVGPAPVDDTLILRFQSSVIVGPGSGFNADARGFPGRTGPGTSSYVGGGGGAGAAHGGAGSDGNNASGGETYGSFAQPLTMGSGSSGNCCSTAGAGGGKLRIIITGSLLNDGRFSADAQTPASGNNIGGGAGGSIWVTCTQLSGTGIFRARGASGIDAAWGSGGGGRISIEHTTSTLPVENYDASGGPGGRLAGGAGTVYLQPGTGQPTLIIDNKSATFGEATEMSGPVAITGDLIINNGGYLAPKQNDPTLSLSVTGDVTIGTLGKAGAEARGFPQRQGPGTSSYVGGGGGAGAGHAGAGSNGSSTAGGGTYGDLFNPTMMGSGGSSNCCSTAGAGGGAFRLICNSLTIDGILSTDAQAPQGGVQTGGGAGGSIYVDSATFVRGSGIITSRGASGIDGAWGSGGGGRIALYFASADPTFPSIDASGGPLGRQPGGAGTIYLKPDAQRGTITIDNASLVNAEYTEVTGTLDWDANLIVSRGASLGPVQNDPSLVFNISGSVLIDAGGNLGADARGHPRGAGPGSFAYVGGGGGPGGSHGGRGGDGSGALALAPVGDPGNPVDMGSGGAGNCCTDAGDGGGLIRLFSEGPLTINGLISANGESGAPGNGGGGAGGAIFIKAPSITGSGFIRANGGTGIDTAWGGGGGGRIALYTCDLTLPLTSILALGAPSTNPARAGDDGTVVLGSSSITIQQQPPTRLRSVATVELEVVATTTQPGGLNYQWRKRVLSGAYQPLTDGGAYSGTQTSTLTITNAGCDEAGFYDCLITDSCGSFPTSATQLTLPPEYDYNQDENVDLLDAQQMAQVFVGLLTPEPNWLDGDLNGDENADLTDAQQLAVYVVTGTCPF
jgi:hypothetical protein